MDRDNKAIARQIYDDSMALPCGGRRQAYRQARLAEQPQAERWKIKAYIAAICDRERVVPKRWNTGVGL